jgi:hypothetical protein
LLALLPLDAGGLAPKAMFRNLVMEDLSDQRTSKST